MSKKSSASGGIGFLGLLCIAFIVLKLCHVIDWRWIWVFVPLWGPAVIVIGIIVIGFLSLYIQKMKKAKIAITIVLIVVLMLLISVLGFLTFCIFAYDMEHGCKGLATILAILLAAIIFGTCMDKVIKLIKILWQ